MHNENTPKSYYLVTKDYPFFNLAVYHVRLSTLANLCMMVSLLCLFFCLTEIICLFSYCLSIFINVYLSVFFYLFMAVIILFVCLSVFQCIFTFKPASFLLSMYIFLFCKVKVVFSYCLCMSFVLQFICIDFYSIWHFIYIY